MSTTLNGRRTPPPPKEVSYVEDTMQYREIVELLEMHQSQLQILLGRQAMQQQLIRDARFALDSRVEAITMRIVEDDAGKSSIAAIDRAIKHSVMSDEELGKMRQALIVSENELIQTDADVREHELGHRAAIARLNAVCSYMDFLRSARDAMTVRERSMPY